MILNPEHRVLFVVKFFYVCVSLCCRLGVQCDVIDAYASPNHKVVLCI